MQRVYPVELGLGKRVVEKPIGFKRKDFSEALAKALEILNRNLSLATSPVAPILKYTDDDFLEGLYRIEPTTGTQYEMYFKTKSSNKSAAWISSLGSTIPQVTKNTAQI